MALPDLHKFSNDLKNRPAKGSDAPPRTIRAKDLDDNFKKVTVIQDKNASYEVDYTADGTILKIFPSPPSGGTHVLGVIDGEIQWIATEDC
jgi:hypothetical protein